MSQSLGTASLILNADGSLLIKKLKESEDKVESWGQRVGKKLKSIGGGFASLGKSMVKGLAMGAGFALGKLGLDSIGGVVDKLKELKDIGEYAQGLGTTGEQMSKLAGLAKYADTDIKQVIEGLATFNGLIAEAGKGGEADKLFKNLGVDAAEFKGMNAYDQFFKLFEALGKSDDPMGRFQMLMKATGEDVGKLMVKLNRLSATELEALAQKYAYSNREIAEATVASEAYADAQLKIEQASHRLAIALAPVVESMAYSLTEALNQNGGAWADWGNNVMPILKGVAVGLAGIVDIARNVPDMLQATSNSWTFLGGAGVAKLGDLFGNKEMSEIGRNLAQDSAYGMDQAAGRLKNFWEIADKTGALFELKAAERMQKIDNLTKDLGKSSIVKGLIDADKKAKEMKPLEASVYGSTQWQKSFANQQHQQQQTEIQLHKQTNAILNSIDKGVGRIPGWRFGLV